MTPSLALWLREAGHDAQAVREVGLRDADDSAIWNYALGPDFLFVDAPFDVPPCKANIAMKIDGNERTWSVYLSDGISASSVRVAIATAAQCSGAGSIQGVLG